MSYELDNTVTDKIERAAETATDSVYKFIEDVKPNHAISLFFFIGVILGFIVSDYFNFAPLANEYLALILLLTCYSALVTGLLIMKASVNHLSVNFLIKMVWIVFVGFVFQYQFTALFDANDSLKPIFGGEVTTGRSALLGWMIYTGFLAISLMFCFVAKNEK